MMKEVLIWAMIVSVFPLLAYSNDRQVPPVEGLVQPKVDLQTVTVGGPGADLAGFDSKSIQLAVDALKARGGGVVKLNPGTFQIIGPVHLYSNIILEGAGPATVLEKSDGFRTQFVIDADYGMLKVTVKDASGFEVGSGIQLFDDSNKQGWNVTTAVVRSIDENTLYIDKPTKHDYIASKNGVISNAFPVVEGIDVENVRIANLLVEGNGDTNDYINGCVGGGVYLHKAKDCLIEKVHVNNFNGDSFSWQVTENITVRHCEASGGGGLGFHPGTGSHNSVVENNLSHHNAQDGIFLCWRVQHGLFRNNTCYENKRHGISIGHKDTDNLFLNNHIYENGRHGVFFRDENEQNGGHRNTFRNNIVENNGTVEGPGYGFYVGGQTRDILIEKNTIRSTGKGDQKAAVWIGSASKRIAVRENQVSGHQDVVNE
jgi:parallel beta-helix repeat protein